MSLFQAVVTATGKNKTEVIKNLLDAVKDFKEEQANNAISSEWEYDLYLVSRWHYLGEILDFKELEDKYFTSMIGEIKKNELFSL